MIQAELVAVHSENAPGCGTIVKWCRRFQSGQTIVYNSLDGEPQVAVQVEALRLLSVHY